MAITRIDGGQATIYYNPVLLERLGPQLGDFVLAHEEGHVHFGHAGGALLTSQPDFAQVRQRQELEADCWAAGELGMTNPDAVRAAIRFFTALGPVRFDRVHPTGEQRVARIAVHPRGHRRERRHGVASERRRAECSLAPGGAAGLVVER